MQSWRGCLQFAAVFLVLAASRSAAAPFEIARQILRPDGKPAAGASVAIHARTTPYDWQTIRLRADATGHFAINMDAATNQYGWGGSGYAMIDAPGCALMFLVFPDWGENTTQARAPIRLTAAYSIPGKVLDESDAPVGGAHIALLNVPGIPIPDMCGGPFPSSLPTDPVAMPEITAISEEDGTFVLRGIDTSIWRRWGKLTMGGLDRLDGHHLGLGAVEPKRGLVWRGAATFPVKLTDSITPTKITMQAALSVKGQVLDALTGEPLPDVKLRSGNVWGNSDNSAMTDADGRFEIGMLPPAPQLSLGANREGFAHASLGIKALRPDPAQANTKLIKISNLQKVENLTIHLNPLATITGKVVDEESGDGIARACLYPEPVLPTEIIGAGWITSQSGYAQAQVAKTDGSFTMSLPVGAHTLRLTGPYEFINSDKAPYREQVEIKVPASGLQNAVLKVRKQPGYWVRFEPLHPEKLKSGYYEMRARIRPDDAGQNYLYLNNSLSWFLPASRWGESMEIQINNTQPQAVVIPWTRIKADPNQWPLVIHIP